MTDSPTADQSTRLWRELESQRALAQESRETLIRLETQLANLTSNLDELRTGSAMPRCTDHARRIDALDRDFQGFSTKIWRFASILAASMIMLGVSSLWEIITQ
ncbi:MAG: hypothetical protein ACNI3A_12155 [Desulfovibrio sp.]|uniref:hypothetical protein n=1 Tax=Desulfovibrio sp. 7SRBS1 TaxID=3378064 RepID=UPI003B3FADD5